MPYNIRKKGSGYVVVTTTTGKEHGKTTKPKAEAQLRILQSVMNR